MRSKLRGLDDLLDRKAPDADIRIAADKVMAAAEEFYIFMRHGKS